MIHARRLAVLTLGSAIACGRSQGVPDQDLGNLVIEAKQPDTRVVIDRAVKEPAELGTALLQPYRKVVTALGPHTVSIATTTLVEEAGATVTQLGDRTSIKLGENGAFQAQYDNTADYGREAMFVGGKLYLRPRYQRWHVRAPETADEPLAVRDGFFAPIAAMWDLLAPACELTDLGTVQIAGRAGRKIAVKLSPTPVKIPAERLAQRAWRAQRTIEAVTGEVVLDPDHGAPLFVQLAGTISFMRDGRRFKMKISITSAISDIGTASALTAPAEVEVVATPERMREVDERDFLLQGIAPPLRKNADGTAATPQLPSNP